MKKVVIFNNFATISTYSLMGGAIYRLDLFTYLGHKRHTGSSRLMQISLLRISLLRFFKTITKIWLMRFYGLFILLLRT